MPNSNKKWPEPQLKPITWLKPFKQNPKRHSPEQVAQIRASMDQWGWTIPVLADEKGEIIAGHGRVLAAQIPPAINEAPVLIAKGWTDADKRAYRIADNKLTELGQWDDQALRLEMRDLQAKGFNLELTGFALPDIKDFLGAIAPLGGLPALPTGDKSPFEQITFTLHTSQVKDVRAAMKAADAMGPYTGMPNDNKNGNAIARVAKEFLKQAKGKKK